MKPTFALDLSRDAIALLHRNPKGWLSIGEVAFDAPDLDDGVDQLRKAALGVSPAGMTCKIILPNSQILYTEVTAPGPSRNDKRRQIAEALEGRTPYAVEDLVFDWSGKGATVKVAVVARETLDEAEAFATTHRLNPVSFVAIPPEGSFVGEAWFGPTTAAETLLAPGEVVDRDRDVVTILHREPPVAEAPVAEAPPPDALPEPVAADADDAPLVGLEEALNADLPEPVAEPAGDVPLPEPAAQQTGPVASDATVPPAVTEAAAPSPAEGAEEAAEVALKKALDDAPLTDEPPAAPAPGSEPLPEVEEAPFAHVTDTSAFPDDDPGPQDRDLRAADDDIPPAPSSAAIAAFASRRSAMPEPTPAKPVGPAAQGGRADLRSGQQIPRPTPPKGFAGPVTAPSIPGTRPKPKGKVLGTDAAAASLGGAPATKSPARPGGTFGTAAPPRNRSGVVFMVLVGLLLLFLAVIAAWSSFWLSRNGSTQQDVGQVIDAPVPGVDEEMLADMQDPEGMEAPLPEAEGVAPVDVGALATEDVPVGVALDGAAAETAPQPADEAVAEASAADPAPTAETAAAAPAKATVAEVEPAPEPAPGTQVTTDLTAAQAPVEDQDEIFLAAMDTPPPALDAMALPAPAAVADTAPAAPMPPPAFGTVYRFDANGLVMPTPEGILSPDGVLLIAGPPPRVPPPRSEVAIAAALAAAPIAPEAAPEATGAPTAGDASLVTATEEPALTPAPADPAMAGFRPRPRPEGLAPATDDDAALATEAPTAVAGLRPLARPASVVAAAAAAAPAESPDLGAQAASLAAQAAADLAAAAALEASNPSIVAISRRPEARPRDLSRAVEAAVAAAVRAPEPEPQPEPEAQVVAAAAAPAPELKPEELEEVEEPEPAKAAPKIPTKASVAKQATYRNAINLSRISLIGTYGTESKRYALIRQANGRYKKVKVGDRIDGGTVKAITANEVRYQKGGKLVTLAMPKA